MNIREFAHRKRDGVPISMVTCYDAWSASLIAATEIDCILVGDSVAMVVYGHDTTIPADMEMMTAHTAAVRRGAPEAFIIGEKLSLCLIKAMNRKFFMSHPINFKIACDRSCRLIPILSLSSKFPKRF